jgi:hypothetical protein
VVIFASVEPKLHHAQRISRERKLATPILLFSSRKTAKNPSLPELETFQEERGWRNPLISDYVATTGLSEHGDG